MAEKGENCRKFKFYKCAIFLDLVLSFFKDCIKDGKVAKINPNDTLPENVLWKQTQNEKMNPLLVIHGKLKYFLLPST